MKTLVHPIKMTMNLMYVSLESKFREWTPLSMTPQNTSKIDISDATVFLYTVMCQHVFHFYAQNLA